MIRPMVSVALCTCNGNAFLREQLDSLVHQTRPPDEVIICDDASTDATVHTLHAFAANAPFPTRIFQNSVNLGYVRSFEKAVSYCAGDIIFLCDQDDVWVDKKIEVMLEPFVNPAVEAVFSDALIVNRKLAGPSYSFWHVHNFLGERRRRFETGHAFVELLKGNIVQGASLAFRSCLRRVVLPFSPNFSHDHWIALQIAAVSALVPIDEKLIMHRQHGANAIGVPSPRFRRARELGRKIGTIGTKVTGIFAPRPYYEKKRKQVSVELQRLVDLRERLCMIDGDNLATSIAAVDQQIEKVNQRLARYKRKLQRGNTGRG